MKKIFNYLLFCTVAILLVGCSDGSKIRVDESKSQESNSLVVTVGNYSDMPESSKFKVVWMEGHKYIIMTSSLDSRISGLTHAGSCPCYKKGGKE